MTTATASPNYHGTLTANAVDTITLSAGSVLGPNEQIVVQFQVIETDLASPGRIDYTIDGSDPEVGGTPTGRVLPGLWVDIVSAVVTSAAPIVVKLISADELPWEGIVWHHSDGRMAKLKRRDFA